MAIYHLSIKIGSRGKGQSAIAAAAYRSGEKLTDTETGLISDYTRKGGVVFSEIALCENAPAEYSDRATLWNAVHQIEKNSNAQLWREFEVALPQELSREKQIQTVRDFVKGLNAQGMCVDWSLHDKGDGNPHAHIMTTMRSITEDGKWAPKSRLVYDLDEQGERIFQKVNKQGRKQYKSHKEDYNNWNAADRVEEWRTAWAECCNARLADRDHIDHRSYVRQGKKKVPTMHEGYVARKISKRGQKSTIISYNAKVRRTNDYSQATEQDLQAVEAELKQLVAELEKLKSEQKGQKKNELNARIAELLARRSRTVNNTQPRTTNGERTVQTAEQPTGNSDTDALIREAEAVRASARAAVADTRATIEQSSSKLASSTASRSDREAERASLQSPTDEERKRRTAKR